MRHQPTVEELKAKIAAKGYSLVVDVNSITVEGGDDRVKLWVRRAGELPPEQLRRLLHRAVLSLGWRI